MIGDRFIDAFVAQVFADDVTPPAPDVVEAFREGVRRGLYLADELALREHRAGMCRTAGRCRRRAMLGTNTCEVHAAAVFGITVAELAAGYERLLRMREPRIPVDDVPDEVVEFVRPDGRKLRGRLLSRHPQGDVVVADFNDSENEEE